MVLRGAIAAAALVIALPALAQTVPVEHDPQKSYTAPPVSVAPPNLDPVLADTTPIEGPLSGVLFLGEADTVVGPGAVPAGVDTHLVPLLDDPAFKARMQAYLGTPVSLQLVADIEAEVANWARGQGMPFVSISTPEQEITGGVLQFRVLEFRVGKRDAVATGRMTPEQALAAVRVQPGQTIDSNKLAEDLNWLSRSPFRDATADFAPGSAPGETDMTVRIQEAKPWLVTAGYDNSGAQSTGRNRLRASVSFGDLPTPGSVLTYQIAVSPDAFSKGVAPFGGHAAYQSHTFSATVPTMPRQNFEATFDMLESNSFSSPFDIRSQIVEGAAGYRLAASELGLPAGWGDVFAGIELRRGVLESRFGGTLATTNTAEIAQFYAGWSNSFTDDNGSTDVSAEVRLSPGGLTPSNSGSAFSLYTSGRVTDARYGYVKLNVNRSTNLPNELVLRNSLSVQLASGPLIDTEQMSMGGASAVRGYLPDDGAYDAGAISRNSIYFAPFDLGSGNSFSPFLLADAGVGYNPKTGASRTFASAGGGTDFRLAGHFDGSLTGAVALTDATVTRRGDVNLMLRVGGQY